MRRTLINVIVALAAVATPVAVTAADLSVVRERAPVTAEAVGSCSRVWKCGPNGCDWVRACPRRCPDRFSCAPLYGAYGPYGGYGYWAAYTDNGWGHRRW